MNTGVSFGRAFIFSSVLALAATASPLRAEGIAAGTLIENTASATYDDGSGVQSIDSNTVTLRVDELLDVTLTSLDSGPISTAPGSEVLTFELTNTGNGPEAFELSANPSVAGNDFDTTIDGIAIDTNGNGVYDPGVDALLAAPETTLELPADDSFTVFVLVTVPAGTGDGEQSDVELIAEAVTGTGAPGTVFAGQGVNGGDAVVGTTGADATAMGSLVAGLTSVALVKSADVLDPFGGPNAVPGAIVTFTIEAILTGSSSVDDLVVTDAIPDDTTYVAETLTLDGSPLTDASGDDEGEASDAAGIIVDLGTVPGGTTHTITFNVTID